MILRKSDDYFTFSVEQLAIDGIVPLFAS